MDPGFKVGMGVLLWMFLIVFCTLPVIRLVSMLDDKKISFLKFISLTFATGMLFICLPLVAYFKFFVW